MSIDNAKHLLRCHSDELRALLASPQDSAGAVAWRVSSPNPDHPWKSYDQYPAWAEGRESLTIQPLYTAPQPAGPAVEVAGEREAFESAWDVTTNSNGGVAYHVEITGKYCFSDIQQGFQMFQAGAAWQRTQSAGVPECSYCQGHGEVTRQTGQTPEQYECWNEVCPDCVGTGSAAPRPAQQPNPDVARLRE